MKKIERALRGLNQGAPRQAAIRFLRESGYEVRENRHMQQTACDGTQFHTVTIGLYDCDEEYTEFQYGYTPSHTELRNLLSTILSNGTTDVLMAVDPILV